MTPTCALRSFHHAIPELGLPQFPARLNSRDSVNRRLLTGKLEPHHLETGSASELVWPLPTSGPTWITRYPVIAHHSVVFVLCIHPGLKMEIGHLHPKYQFAGIRPAQHLEVRTPPSVLASHGTPRPSVSCTQWLVRCSRLLHDNTPLSRVHSLFSFFPTLTPASVMHLSLFHFLLSEFCFGLCCHVINKLHTRSALLYILYSIFAFPPCTCRASFLFSLFLVYRASCLPASPMAGEYCSGMTSLSHYKHAHNHKTFS